MIDVGITDFYIAIPNLSKSKLEAYSNDLFDEWESQIDRTLLIPDYSLSLQVEEGSIKGSGKITALLGAIYWGICNYGSFISGLQIVQEQAIAVGDFLGKVAKSNLGPTGVDARVRKRSGTLGALQRLFVQVQRGQMSAEQATREAEAMLGEDAQASPEFMRRMRQSLADAPLFHQQIPLPLDESGLGLPLESEKRRRPRKPYEPVWPPPGQYRVEVWRESKKEKKNVLVVNL